MIGERLPRRRHPVPVCWICNRRLYAGGRAVRMFVDDQGIERPAHDFCLASEAMR